MPASGTSSSIVTVAMIVAAWLLSLNKTVASILRELEGKGVPSQEVAGVTVARRKFGLCEERSVSGMSPARVQLMATPSGNMLTIFGPLAVLQGTYLAIKN